MLANGNTVSPEATNGGVSAQLVLEWFRTLGDRKYDHPKPFGSGTC
jgi:hypothetical protein